MRETFGTLLQQTKNYCIDDSASDPNSSLTNTEALLKTEINNAIIYMLRKLNMYKTIPLARTMTTVADQIYYHMFSGLNSITSAVMTIGDIDYPMEIISSRTRWDRLQQLTVAASTIPLYIFPRQHSFGIYPTPQDAYTVTVVGNYLPIRLTVDDYNTGTVDTTQNSTTITGTNTVFTSTMENRWFCVTDGTNPNGRWYRIGSYASTTSFTLETYFEEPDLSGTNYVIGESPEIPEESHYLIPYKAAAAYYATVRRDAEQAQRLLNYFYTGDYFNSERRGKIEGGFLGIVSRYKHQGRGSSPLIKMHRTRYDRWNSLNEAWSAVLSEA